MSFLAAYDFEHDVDIKRLHIAHIYDVPSFNIQPSNMHQLDYILTMRRDIVTVICETRMMVNNLLTAGLIITITDDVQFFFSNDDIIGRHRLSTMTSTLRIFFTLLRSIIDNNHYYDDCFIEEIFVISRPGNLIPISKVPYKTRLNHTCLTISNPPSIMLQYKNWLITDFKIRQALLDKGLSFDSVKLILSYVKIPIMRCPVGIDSTFRYYSTRVNEIFETIDRIASSAEKLFSCKILVNIEIFVETKLIPLRSISTHFIQNKSLGQFKASIDKEVGMTSSLFLHDQASGILTMLSQPMIHMLYSRAGLSGFFRYAKSLNLLSDDSGENVAIRVLFSN